jgi:hypothetical protein
MSTVLDAVGQCICAGELAQCLVLDKLLSEGGLFGDAEGGQATVYEAGCNELNVCIAEELQAFVGEFVGGVDAFDSGYPVGGNVGEDGFF